MKPDLFQAPDYYLLDDLLTEEHKLVRDSARAWVKREVSPIIEDYAQRAEFPKQIIKGLGEIGGFGPYIPEEYGGAGLDQISYGLIMQEIERGDSGVRSTSSVQSSLVMYPIWKFGTEEQRQKYLPKLATGEFMGCFGLTEPDFGSDPSGMVTNFKDMGNHYLLNGAKMWISNAPFADVAVEEYDRLMAVNVRGIFFGAQAAAKAMSDGGRIVNIGSNLADRTPFPGLTLYTMSKTALIGLTRGLARDLGPRGITVNLVQPGSTDTDMNPADGPMADMQRGFMAIPRFATPAEIAGAVAYLAAPEARGITGTALTVDGGMNI